MLQNSIMQEWVTDIRESVLESQSAVFLQAMGRCAPVPAALARAKKRAGRTLEGRTWDEMPVNVGWVRV
jgi:protein gp37